VWALKAVQHAFFDIGQTLAEMAVETLTDYLF
jgi:hypothetical protein